MITPITDNSEQITEALTAALDGIEELARDLAKLSRQLSSTAGALRTAVEMLTGGDLTEDLAYWPRPERLVRPGDIKGGR